jgi:hypothetical protein
MEIHIARDGEQFGPFPPNEVRRQLAAGTLLPTDLAWAEGAIGWVPLGSLPNLAAPPSPVAPVRRPTPFPARLPVITSRLVPPPEPVVTIVPRTSGAAVASLVCGVLSVSFLPIILPGIAAVVCGHLARSQIRKGGGQVLGEGMATAGLVTGYFGVGLIILMGIVVASAFFFSGATLPFVRDLQVKEKLPNALTNAKTIATACHMYALEHHDVFPRTLEDLVPKYLPERSSLTCPLTPDMVVGYEYFGGTTMDTSDKALFMSKYIDPRGRRIIGRVDGSCVFEIPATP